MSINKQLSKSEEDILTIDIETSPIIAYTWGPKWETNLIQIIEESKILSFSAKWLNGKHITKGLINYKGYKPGIVDDKEIVKDLWELLDKANIIITQNGRAFDTKTINARIIYHKLNPPSPYKIIDTKTVAKGVTRLPSYSLNDMCDYHEIGRKKEHEGFGLWKKCIAGNKDAWKRMLQYNANDVILTEQLYLKYRPWIKNHPSLGLLGNKICCPKCGSKKLHSKGYIMTTTKKYKRAQCQECGGWMRYPIAEVQTEKPYVSI